MYFNGRALKGNGHGACSDIETHEVYWISGIKKMGKTDIGLEGEEQSLVLYSAWFRLAELERPPQRQPGARKQQL